MGALATGTTGSGFGSRLESRSTRSFAKWGTPEVHGKERPNNSFIFNKKEWCPGWESNPHEEKSPEDFKSSASAIPPPGRWHYKSSGEKHVLQHYCVDSQCLVTTSVCTHQQSLRSLAVLVNLIQQCSLFVSSVREAIVCNVDST